MDDVTKALNNVEGNAKQIEEIVNNLVNDYCKEVDSLVAVFKEILQDEENPPSDLELDDMVMKLPTYLYFMGHAQETFGIREDVAKSVKMEVYNKVYQTAKGTIPDKQALSESNTLYEDMVWKAYQRACKRVKQKLEAAYELLQSIKKVCSRRMLELELSRTKDSSLRK